MGNGQTAPGSSARRLVFVNHVDDVGDQERGTEFAILDPAWTPIPGARPDLLPIRPALWQVIRTRDVHNEAVVALDDWAARAGMARRLDVGGTSWWYHVRGFLRLDLHELILWRHVLEVLAPAGRYDRIEVPSDRPHLISALEASPTGLDRPEVTVIEALTGAPQFQGGKPSKARIVQVRPGYRRTASRAMRALRRLLDRPARARARQLRERFGRIADDGPEVLAVVRGESFHLVSGPDGDERSDPIVGPVVRRLTVGGRRVIQVILGALPATDGQELIPDDGRLPMDVLTDALTTRSELVDDREDLRRRVNGIESVRLEVAGADLGPALCEVVASLDKWFARQMRERLVALRLLAAFRPRVVLTGWEASRTAWLAAARARGVPTVSIQHGVIYPRSPDYYRPEGPGLARPDVMCVFGSYERRLLVDECRYPADGVVATGSPRMNAEALADAIDPGDREAVRRELEIGPGERMLVISGARHAVGEGLHSTTVFAGLLDGELPGVHIVVKLHPEEDQGDHYPALITGLAAAGGYPAPPVTIVRHIDLFRVLRAADAHLGIYSTVLTDAILAGTPTMVAVGQAWSDLVGYAAAGVAQPVASVAEVRAFMSDPRVPSPEHRAAFLRDHYAPGDAAARIADLVASLGQAPSGDARRRVRSTAPGPKHAPDPERGS